MNITGLKKQLSLFRYSCVFFKYSSFFQEKRNRSANRFFLFYYLQSYKILLNNKCRFKNTRRHNANTK
jgi:hypothetical protein